MYLYIYIRVKNTSPRILYLKNTVYFSLDSCVLWMNYPWFLGDSCRCSLQHAAGHSARAAEARCRTGPATTSRCSGPRARRGRCYTRWRLSHTGAPQTLRRGHRECFRWEQRAGLTGPLCTTSYVDNIQSQNVQNRFCKHSITAVEQWEQILYAASLWLHGTRD